MADSEKANPSGPNVWSSTLSAGPHQVLMWVGVAAVSYQWLVVPIFSLVYSVWTGHALPVAPMTIDGNLVLMLGGLMGLHMGASSWESMKSGN